MKQEYQDFCPGVIPQMAQANIRFCTGVRRVSIIKTYIK